jgi:type IV secretory pathway VirD2 relaxase
MVKVLSRGGQDLGAIRRHLDYLRLRDDGEIELETDDGQFLLGQAVSKELVKDWDLDLEEHRRRADLDARRSRSPKFVHKLMFSMPAGTPPQKVLAAVRNFAREQFGLKHRYAMALHTDEPHPHVHMVVKAISEQGVRLHIRKATLRDWRREFARQLRALGVAANATERAVRGETRESKPDQIYRASLRGDSTYVRAQAEAVAAELLKGDTRVEPSKRALVITRLQVENGWRSVASLLAKDGHHDLANDVRRFVERMQTVKTERELIADELMLRAKAHPPRENQRSR